MTKRYAVFGKPVAHSRSPFIHAAFAEQLGIALDYTAIESSPEDFARTLQDFVAAGGVGGNVTLPLKGTAFALCASHSERARRAGAVNTLAWKDGAWFGDNTDGAGLVRDLTDRFKLDLRDRRVLLLGAGGAARGIAPALVDAGIGKLYIVNRSPEKADALSDAIGEPARVHTRYWEQLDEMGGFDLIVNTTSAGRANPGKALDLPFSLLSSQRSDVVDINYGEAAIPMLAWARAAGADDIIDGLGMLVEQAAESFQLWHGERPQTDDVYAALRGQVALKTAD